MLRVENDEFPPEMWIHVFSFIPSLHDALALTSTNSHIRSFYYNPTFWRRRAPLDFFCEAPKKSDASLFYSNIKEMIKAEKQLCCSYIAAYNFVAESVLSEEEKLSAIEKLDNALEHLSTDGFMSVIKQPIYGGVEIKHGGNHLFLTNESWVEVKALRDEPDMMSDTYRRSTGFFLRTLATCNAHLSLNVLLHTCTPKMRDHFMQVLGADLLCRATSFGHVEMVKLLLRENVSPNQYGFYMLLDTLKLQAQPVHLLIMLLRKSKRILSKGVEIAEIFNLFLENGINLDAPLTHVSDANDEVNAALPSLRTALTEYRTWMNHPRRSSTREEVDYINNLTETVLRFSPLTRMRL